MPYLHSLSKTSITMFCVSLVSRVWLFVGEDILRDKMNGTMRFSHCLVPCCQGKLGELIKNSLQNLLYRWFCLLVHTWKQFCVQKSHNSKSESLLNRLNCWWLDNHNQSIRLFFLEVRLIAVCQPFDQLDSQEAIRRDNKAISLPLL